MSDLLQAAAVLLAAKNYRDIPTTRQINEAVSEAMALETEVNARRPKPVTINDVRAMRGAPPLDLVS